jgi:ribulose-5-phosphate 4-epimerase/fuculose-1-phosphate aldolase
MNLGNLKQDIVTASHILHQQGIAAAFGHVSARIPGTDTFIFPPRMSPALVRLDNLLVLDVEGNQLSGDGRPNTEFWIHARIYKARPDVQSVCHVHPPSCVVLGSLGENIRPLHASGAIFRNDVQIFDPITLIRTRELGDQVAQRRPARLCDDPMDGRSGKLSTSGDVGRQATVFHSGRARRDLSSGLARRSFRSGVGVY